MKKTREFENILNDCLERVLKKTATVEECLACYPDEAAELEPLLRTALTARDAAALTPRAEFRERARYQFQAALRDMEAGKGRSTFSWQPRWAVAVITVVVAVLVAGSGTVAAASNSLPDQPLYMVKLATEAVQLTLTSSAQDKAELYVKFADRRVAEMIEMADEGKVAQVESLTQRLNSQLLAMADLSLPDGEAVDTLSAASQDTVTEAAPNLAVPAPTTAAPTTTVPPQAILPVPAPTPASTPVPSVTVNTPQMKGGERMRDGQDKRARMREILQDSADANQNALEAALAKAPPSVREALRQALEEIMAGYEQTIRHWNKGR